MNEAVTDSRDEGFLRELAPGVWRLTGEVTNNLLDRVNFTARVLVGATIARVEDLDSFLNPLSAQEILANDARKHIGAMALEKGLRVPDGFVSPT